ncbi:hypothetical protein FJZ48_04450, partial [Candidatus Uhrbacteria bacterium]|nr:hypothetical protein [Candidatus Uhrbacteria bacterium]
MPRVACQVWCVEPRPLIPMKDEPLFISDTSAHHLQVDLDEGESNMIQHEVFYESSVNTIHDRPLFLGRSYLWLRFFSVGVMIGLLFFGLMTRAFWMQIVNGTHYQVLAENNRLRRTPLHPRRGIIYDRQGRVLAENISRFQVTLTPRNVTTDPIERGLQLGEATRILGMSIKDIQPFLHSTSTALDEEVIISQNVPYAQAMQFAIALPRLSGFDLEVGAERRYPLSSQVTSVSHVLGYVGKLSPEEYKTRKQEGYR